MSFSRVIRGSLQDLEGDIVVPVVGSVRLDPAACAAQEDITPASAATRVPSADDELKQAREESERILAAAKSEADRLRQNAYDEAFEAGIQNAREETEQACRVELETAHKQVKSMLQDAQTQRNQALTSLQDVMTELVIEAVEGVLHAPDVVDRVNVMTRVADLIELEVRGENVQVRMHPDDIAVAGTFSPSDNRLSTQPVAVKPDDTLTRGGCVVMTDTEEIDATLETQLEVLKPNVRLTIGRVLDERNRRVPAGVQTEPVLSRLRSRE